MKNLVEIYEIFLKLEYENDWFYKTIDDIYIWDIVRDRILDNICIESGLVEEKAKTVASNKIGKILSFFNYCKNAFVNVFTPIKKHEVLIVNHPRKIKQSNEYVDIYTDWLLKIYDKQNRDYLLLDVPLNWSKHLITKTNKVRYLDNFTIFKKVYYKFFAKNSLTSNTDLLFISQKLKEEFGTDGNLLNVCFAQLNIFKADFKYYKKILKKIEPQKIFYVVINNMYPLIAAAKELEIEIEEIQHGLISRYHQNYSIPYLDKINYFPDRFFLFGEYWKDITPFPLDENSFDYYRLPICDEKVEKATRNKNNKIMFISQPNISTQMFEFLEQMSKYDDFKNYEFIIKLHPAEYHVWKEDYTLLKQLSKLNNVTVVDNFEISLYELFKQVDSVVGVGSTALFEAMYFKCDVYLINVSGVEVVQALMNEDVATFVKTPKDLLNIVNIQKSNSIESSYIFSDRIRGNI